MEAGLERNLWSDQRRPLGFGAVSRGEGDMRTWVTFYTSDRSLGSVRPRNCVGVLLRPPTSWGIKPAWEGRTGLSANILQGGGMSDTSPGMFDTLD